MWTVCSDSSCKGSPPPPLTEQKLSVSELYRKRSYNLLADGTSGFNMDALENDIILTYIAPKFKFEALQSKKYYFRTQNLFKWENCLLLLVYARLSN